MNNTLVGGTECTTVFLAHDTLANKQRKIANWGKLNAFYSCLCNSPILTTTKATQETFHNKIWSVSVKHKLLIKNSMAKCIQICHGIFTKVAIFCVIKLSCMWKNSFIMDLPCEHKWIVKVAVATHLKLKYGALLICHGKKYQVLKWRVGKTSKLVKAVVACEKHSKLARTNYIL